MNKDETLKNIERGVGRVIRGQNDLLTEKYGRRSTKIGINELKQTANLITGVLHEDIQLIDRSLAKGADINYTFPSNGLTPLQIAESSNFDTTAAYLRKRGAK